MKKRLLSALLALALVFVLLPTTALADTTPVTDENVKINGTPVTVGNGISLGEGNGTYSYDKSTRTLTLNNATITATGSNIVIDFCDTTNYVTYSVILTGENTVTSNNIAIETTPNTNLTFTGGGNLKAITNGYYQAIRVYGTLTIDNSTLIAESSAYTATTVIWTLAMTGNNAKLEISNKSAANIVAGTAASQREPSPPSKEPPMSSSLAKTPLSVSGLQSLPIPALALTTTMQLIKSSPSRALPSPEIIITMLTMPSSSQKTVITPSIWKAPIT